MIPRLLHRLIHALSAVCPLCGWPAGCRCLHCHVLYCSEHVTPEKHDCRGAL